jgi:cytochrome c556
MKKTVALVLGAVLFGTLSVSATPAKSAKHAKDVTQYRQAILKLVKSNVGALGAMNKGAIPLNADTLIINSLRLEQLSLMLHDYFATDTSGFDVDTEALDKLWKHKSDFNDKIEALTVASRNLNKVAKIGDINQFKPAIGQVFKSCKGCHESYKAD